MMKSSLLIVAISSIISQRKRKRKLCKTEIIAKNMRINLGIGMEAVS